MTMKLRYYRKNPEALLCFVLGHSRDDDTEHTLCGGETTLAFCERCCYLFKGDET